MMDFKDFNKMIKSYDEKIESFEGKYRWLSNFWPCVVEDFELRGIVYPTVEHAYQASKILSFKRRIHISKMNTPNLAKKAGNRIVLRKDWDDKKIYIMYEYLVQKFNQEKFKKLLLETYETKIIEGNWWNDDFWGVCDPNIGQNNLGKIIMKIRNNLQIAQKVENEEF